MYHIIDLCATIFCIMSSGTLDAFRGLIPIELKNALEHEAKYPDVDPDLVPNNIADGDATRTFHEPTVTPAAGTNSPGQEPNISVIGSTLVAEFTLNTDKAYRIFKIPSSYVSDPAFHIHWTKSSDADENGKEVKWRISYTVFPGNGADVNVSPTVLDIVDTYDDTGTTTRVINRTANTAVAGFTAGYYVGICVEAVTPAGTAMASEPALFSVDLTFTEKINE